MRVNKYITIILLTVSILPFGTPAFADFQAGVDAYENGDYATALKKWKPLAEQGDAKAQVLLGFMYGFGQGVTQDYKGGLKWFKLAAEQGNSGAHSALGGMYAIKGVKDTSNLPILRGYLDLVVPMAG